MGTVMCFFKPSFSISLLKWCFNERQGPNYPICISVMRLVGSSNSPNLVSCFQFVFSLPPCLPGC